jgi:hypothetical protein
MQTLMTTPPPSVGSSAVVRLGSGHGASHAEQARSLGIVVGDAIIGREYYGEDGWSEAEITLLWLGNEACVWRHRWRNANNPELWYNGGEQVNWSLTCREWFKKANEPALAGQGITTTDP